jgi:cytidylate kinase
MAILTISRQLGSGGREIGRAVAEVMGYQCIDRRQILQEMGKAGKQWEDQAERFDEVSPGVWERYKWSFRGYVALTQSLILQYALQDKVVIIGRGGAFLLKGIPHVLSVHIEAPMEQRIARILNREEVGKENARYLIDKVDKDMRGAVYLIYGKMWGEKSEYDMVFNTGVSTAQEIVDAIKNALIEKEQFNTEKARGILGLWALGAKIKAEIAIDPTIQVSTLDVEPKEMDLPAYGVIVSGVTPFEHDEEKIRKITGRIAGTVPVEYRIQRRWRSRLGPWRYE